MIGIVLKLEGTDAPVNGNWVDSTNNKSVALTNTIYDSTEKYYDFGSSAYGDLGEVILPRTDNFTLEVMLKIPDTFTNTEDQAIVSQVNNSSNDSGRFKFNFKVTSGTPTLLVWVNKSSVNSPGTYNFVTPRAGGIYTLQLVRTNDTLDLYINGALKSSNAFDSTNIISQTNFKLARWQTSSTQYFKGKIYAVRVYDRILNSTEIKNNYRVDQRIYNTGARTIREYAVETDFTTTGNGLYADGEGYRYRGTDVNNYLKFDGDSDVYRIINFDSDGTMKLLNTSREYNVAFDASGNRDPVSSRYCTSSASSPAGETDYYGCNYFNTTDSVIGGSDDNVSEFASIKDVLNTTFYTSLSADVKNKIVAHAFETGRTSSGVAPSTIVTEMNNDTWTGNIGTLTSKDMYYSSSSLGSTIGDNYSMSSYIIGLTTSTTMIWSMNGSTANTWDVWTVSKGASVSKRRASRTVQIDGSTTYVFYAYPAFYVNSNYLFTGTGTEEDPYIIYD